LILWAAADRQMWGAIIKRLHLGTARQFSNIDSASIVPDLRPILDSDYVARARMVASQMATASESATATAEVLDDSARLKCVGATGGGISQGTESPR